MSYEQVPPRGKEGGARSCQQIVSGELGTETEERCGRPANRHVFWDKEGTNSFLCQYHYTKAVSNGYRPRTRHIVGPCCGMPNAYYFPLSNTCGYDKSEGLPTAEPVRNLRDTNKWYEGDE